MSDSPIRKRPVTTTNSNEFNFQLVFFFQTRVLVTHGIRFLPQVDQIVVIRGGNISEVKIALSVRLVNYAVNLYLKS